MLLTATACCREERCPQRWKKGGGGGRGHFLCGVWYPFSLWSVVPFFAVECGTLFLCGVWYPFFSVECGTLFLCGVWYPFSLWSVVPFFSVERGTLFLCRVSYPSSVEAGHSVQEEVSFIKGTGNLPSFSSGKTLELR